MWWLLGGEIALVLLISLAWVAFSDSDEPAACEQQPFDENAASVVESITSTKDGIEIRVWSRESFLMRALPPVLRIGEVDLAFSRYPEGGTLNTLIFIVSPHQFNQMTSGDEMFIYYGSSWQSDLPEEKTEWMKSVKFLPFAKERRDCPPVRTPVTS